MLPRPLTTATMMDVALRVRSAGKMDGGARDENGDDLWRESNLFHAAILLF